LQTPTEWGGQNLNSPRCLKKELSATSTPLPNLPRGYLINFIVIGKGSVQFPIEEPLPIELIKKIVNFKAETNIKKKEKK